MHYVNMHAFGLPSDPVQRKDVEGRPIDQWYFPVPGVSGHYLYSNGDISHSFNYDLINDGYDWIYPTLSSALDAMILYRSKAENDPPFNRYINNPDRNQDISDSISTNDIHENSLPIPSWEVTEYIEFLEPRSHVARSHKWVVANFIPEIQEAERHIYLHDNGKAISRAVVAGDNGSTGLFNSKEEAQKALDEYRAAFGIMSKADQILPDTIVHKLLEPQIIADTFLLWEVISADNPSFALSDSNTIVNVAYKAHFETFQQALFAKLRYERTHRDLMH